MALFPSSSEKGQCFFPYCAPLFYVYRNLWAFFSLRCGAKAQLKYLLKSNFGLGAHLS